MQIPNNDNSGFTIIKKRNQSKSSIAHPSSRSILNRNIRNPWENFDLNDFKNNMQDHA